MTLFTSVDGITYMSEDEDIGQQHDCGRPAEAHEHHEHRVRHAGVPGGETDPLRVRVGVRAPAEQRRGRQENRDEPAQPDVYTGPLLAEPLAHRHTPAHSTVPGGKMRYICVSIPMQQKCET